MKNYNIASHTPVSSSSRIKIISRDFEKLPESKKQELVSVIDSTIDIYLNAIAQKTKKEVTI